VPHTHTHTCTHTHTNTATAQRCHTHAHTHAHARTHTHTTAPSSALARQVSRHVAFQHTYITYVLRNTSIMYYIQISRNVAFQHTHVLTSHMYCVIHRCTYITYVLRNASVMYPGLAARCISTYTHTYITYVLRNTYTHTYITYVLRNTYTHTYITYVLRTAFVMYPGLAARCISHGAIRARVRERGRSKKHQASHLRPVRRRRAQRPLSMLTSLP